MSSRLSGWLWINPRPGRQISFVFGGQVARCGLTRSRLSRYLSWSRVAVLDLVKRSVRGNALIKYTVKLVSLDYFWADINVQAHVHEFALNSRCDCWPKGKSKEADDMVLCAGALDGLVNVTDRITKPRHILNPISSHRNRLHFLHHTDLANLH